MSLINSKQRLIPVMTAAKVLAFNPKDKFETNQIAHSIRQNKRSFQSLVTVRKNGSVFITESSLNNYLREMATLAVKAERETNQWTK